MATIHTGPGCRVAAFAIAAVVAVLISTLGSAVVADAAVPGGGRAWELVTGEDSNNAAPGASSAIAAAGDRIIYSTAGPASGSSVGSLTATNLAVRTSGGWHIQSIGYPYSGSGLFQAPAFAGASEDMATRIWTSPLPLLPGAPANPDNGWYRGTAGGALTLLGSNGGALPTGALVGLSRDAQHVVFQTAGKLLPADAGRTSGNQVYEYAGTTLRMVGVDDGGARLSNCGSAGGSSNTPPGAVSRDGRRIFFMSPATACAGVQPSVYMREDGAGTTKISASRCTRSDCNASAAVRFMGAAADGSVAFLATAQQLTDDDVDSSQDLYRYDVIEDALSRVSVGAPAGANAYTARAYPSADGSRVYFLARGALVPGHGVVGQPNLYRADGDGLHFVATLVTGDVWPSGGSSSGEVQVTASGRYLMFETTAALDAGDTDLVKDVYRYDADSDTLVRVSGPPGGGNAAVAASATVGASVAVNAPRAISADGEHVFFATAEQLLPEDGNGLIDVYEWSEGNLGLVSSGAATAPVTFVGVGADGTAFFSTAESLVAADSDGGDYDLYAARVGGGFPDPPPPPPDCIGAACSPPPAGRLSRTDPASLTAVDRRPAGRITVRRPGRVALRRMVARGTLTLTVSASLPGRVSVQASARIGRHVRTIARGHASAARAGRVVLRLPLSSAARRRLASGGVLSVRVVTRHSRIDRTSVLLLSLKGSR